jgi:D-cysteine desulfhydrase
VTSAIDARVRLGLFPTPLHAVPDLPGLSIKRDDLSGFGLAGNKTRPLEYLIADALSVGSTCVVSGGMSTSNFIGALAEAACRHGLHCHLLVPEPVTDTVSISVAYLVGATVEPVAVPRDELDHHVALRAQELTISGHQAYAVPRGGATPVGALGFYRAVAEITQQHDGPATIVLPVGSGASMAGLLAGAACRSARLDIVGVSVSRPIHEIELTVMELARTTVQRAGGDPSDIDSVRMRLIDRHEGLSAQTTHDSIRALTCRGILMDGHYGLPAWSVAEELARTAPEGDTSTILWHTGGVAGVPALLSEVRGDAHGGR